MAKIFDCTLARCANIQGTSLSLSFALHPLSLHPFVDAENLDSVIRFKGCQNCLKVSSGYIPKGHQGNFTGK